MVPVLIEEEVISSLTRIGRVDVEEEGVVVEEEEEEEEVDVEDVAEEEDPEEAVKSITRYEVRFSEAVR